MHRFTQEDLLQYLYKETSREKTAAIEEALVADWNLREQFDTLCSAQQKLELIRLSPRQQTIDHILNYAEKGLEELSSHA